MWHSQSWLTLKTFSLPWHARQPPTPEDVMLIMCRGKRFLSSHAKNKTKTKHNKRKRRTQNKHGTVHTIKVWWYEFHKYYPIHRYLWFYVTLLIFTIFYDLKQPFPALSPTSTLVSHLSPTQPFQISLIPPSIHPQSTIRPTDPSI